MVKIAIVNEKDEIIGAADRAEARKAGLFHRIARILVFNKQGKVLLQKRSAVMEDSPGKWDFSAAGHVDEGEDYEEAALREAKEELGLSLQSLKPLLHFYTEKNQDGNRIRRFSMLFAATTEQKPKADLTEVAELKWLTLTELDTMVAHRPNSFTTSFVGKYSEIIDAVRSAGLY